jgi:magnesium transporter
LALLVAGSVAISIRFLFPWTFFHLGKDPAFDSGPLATTFQNVPAFIVYYFTFSLIV